MAKRGFWHELKRRHVYRVAVAYVIVGWLLIQVVTQVFPVFHLPDWLDQAMVLLILIGFPIALVLAWAFDATPQGIVRTDAVPDAANAGATTPRRSRSAGIAVGLIGVLIAVIAGGAYWHFGRGRGVAGHAVAASALTARSPDIATRNPGRIAPESAASAAASGLRVVPSPAQAVPIPAKSIAVLPFENLSTDKGNAYFADGMQDLILTKLADIGDLKVISRTSTESYGSHPGNLKVIAQQLGVATILEGSVQKAGNQVLINVQLIDANTDSHIWAQSYTRTLKNVFSVEGAVAEQIATALNAKLSPAESARLATALSNNPAANDLFLRAEHLNSGDNLNLSQGWWKPAISLYMQAIAKAPDFALARANLSILESNLVWNGQAGEDAQRLNADARTQAERALELAPDLADAHLAKGFNDYWGHRQYAAALDSFAAALKLRPNDAEALAARGFVFKHQGKFDAASASLQQAFAQNPRSSNLADELGLSYMVVSRYAEAKTALQQALALDPHNITAKYLYSEAILFANGDLDGAMAAARGSAPTLQRWRIDLLVYQHKYRAALKLFEAMSDPIGYMMLWQARLYQLTGETSKARPLFVKALSTAQTQLKSAADPLDQSLALGDVAAAEIGLGHTAAALAALARSQAQMARVDDHVVVPWVMVLNARHYAAAGRADLAMPLLAKAIASPGNGSHYSPVMLWIDPAWDPIRHDPRFQALLKKYAKYKPATAANAPAATTSMGAL